MKNKLLITGCAGFIGSNITEALADKYDIVGVDNLSTGKNVNMAGFLHKICFVGCDIKDFIKRNIKVDCIIHTAALPRVPRSVKEPVVTHEANVTETLRLLKYAKEVGVKKFIYSSSSSVYGKKNTPVMREDMDKNPASPYALQKWMGEEYCEMFKTLYSLDINILRYFNVWGPRQITEGAYCLVLGKFLQQRKQGKEITVYGDGEQTRAYTYVKDVVKANELALQYKGKHHVFNIGTSEEVSVNQIARWVGGKVKHIVPNPRGKFEERHKSANIDRAKKYLKWQPTINLNKDFRKYL